MEGSEPYGLKAALTEYIQGCSQQLGEQKAAWAGPHPGRRSLAGTGQNGRGPHSPDPRLGTRTPCGKNRSEPEASLAGSQGSIWGEGNVYPLTTCRGQALCRAFTSVTLYSNPRPTSCEKL